MIAFMDIPSDLLERFTNDTFGTKNAEVIYRDYESLHIIVQCEQRDLEFIYLIPDPNHRLILTKHIEHEQRDAYIRFLKELGVNPMLDYERNKMLY